MTIDISKLFNQDLPFNFVKYPDQAKQVGGKIQLTIIGEGGGEWLLDASQTGPRCVQGAFPADTSITLTVEDFQKFSENPQVNWMSLFFAGKIKLQGNVLLAQKLPKLFTLGQ